MIAHNECIGQTKNLQKRNKKYKENNLKKKTEFKIIQIKQVNNCKHFLKKKVFQQHIETKIKQ